MVQGTENLIFFPVIHVLVLIALFTECATAIVPPTK